MTFNVHRGRFLCTKDLTFPAQHRYGIISDQHDCSVIAIKSLNESLLHPFQLHYRMNATDYGFTGACLVKYTCKIVQNKKILKRDYDTIPYD